METETQVSASKFENTNHVILSQIVKNDMFLKIKQQGINCHYIPMIMVFRYWCKQFLVPQLLILTRYSGFFHCSQLAPFK